MIRLLRLQLRNMLRQKFFYICLIFFLLTSKIVLYYIEFKTELDFIPIDVMTVMVDVLKSGVTVLPLIVIALFCCMDFGENTAKNIIARGYTRLEFLISKYIVSLIGVFIFFLASFIFTYFLFGSNGLGYDSSMNYSIINSLFDIVTYAIFFSTMSFLLEKNGSSIVACIFAPQVITVVLNLIDWKFKSSISQYWLTNVSNKFNIEATFANLSYSIKFYILYIIIFITLGIFLSRNREIK